LSRNSVLLRLPFFRGLARRRGWWNPFWVEEYRLDLALWPDRCAEMLKSALPRWGIAESSGGTLFMGYADHDGFTIWPIGFWANQRPMAAGRIVAEAGGCRIMLRVANSNWTLYFVLLWTLLFWTVAALILVNMAAAALDRRSLGGAGILWIFAFFGVLVPAGFLSLFGYRRSSGRNEQEGSRDALLVLQFVEDIFGVRPVRETA
jgi:hypothetical protein